MKPSRLVVVAAAIVIAWSVGRVQGQGSGKKVMFSLRRAGGLQEHGYHNRSVDGRFVGRLQ